MPIKNILYVFISLLIFCYWQTLFATEKPPESSNPLQRHTQQGPVKGFHGKYQTISWHGIPYAQAPVDELRWKAPQSAPLRNNLLIANNNSHMCPQKAGPLVSLNPFIWNDVIGSEDCLYLNIVAPADIQKGEKLPVMLWIHGGGNSIGYKGNRAYSGEKLSSQGRVIFVAINYRLGPLGWFYHPAIANSSTKNADASGNYGTLDIIFALQWVQKNIEYFGGDNKRITVFGESAGGLNTYSMLTSPLAKDLFHGAIVESGGYWANSQKYASAFETEGGHAFSSSEIAKKILRQSKTAQSMEEAKQLVQSMESNELATILRKFDAASLIELYPVRAAGMLDFPALNLDGYVLPFKSAHELFKETTLYNSVPVILGTNKDENKTFLALDPDLVAPIFRIKDKIYYEKVAYYLSNTWKLDGVDRHAESLSAIQNNVYAYRFDWDELPKILYIDLAQLIGAGHGLEIPFVFGEMKSDFNLDLLFTNNKAQKQLSNTMLSYWSNFAHTGNPNHGPHKNLPQWTPWNNQIGADKFLILDSGDKAIKMSSASVTQQSLQQELALDDYLTKDQKCSLYQSMFFKGEKNMSIENDFENFLDGKCTQKITEP